MDGQKEARKRENADAQMDNETNMLAFKSNNYAAYNFIS